MTFHIRYLSSPILGVSRLNHSWMLRDHFTPDSKLRLLPPSWLWWALWSQFPVRDQVSNLSVLRCIFEPTIWLDMFVFFSKRRKIRADIPESQSDAPTIQKVLMWPFMHKGDNGWKALALGFLPHWLSARCYCKWLRPALLLSSRALTGFLLTHTQCYLIQSLPPGKWGRKVLPCTALPLVSYFQVPPAHLKQHFQASVPEV